MKSNESNLLGSEQSAEALDAADPIAKLKQRFELPENTIYLDGNSLGALSIDAKKRARDVIEAQWGKDLITSWNKHNWIELPLQVGEKIAPLIGAGPGQTVCCDSISVNLFKLLSGAITMQPGRCKVVSQKDNFPTDLYMVQGLQQQLGADKCQMVLADEDKIESSLDENVAVLLLTHVNFRSGKIHDMKTLTRLAHQKGILVIWDLAHSAGVLDVQLDECNVDFAVGCGYKYLNGGPGAPAFIYIAKHLQERFSQPLSGWMGHRSPFEFSPHYQGSEGINQCLAGTPSILSMSVLDAALDVFEQISIKQVRTKSIGLGDYFQQCLATLGLLNEFEFSSPLDSNQRGSQVALAHNDAYAICQALIECGVVADFRSPNILRFGFAPLYISYGDVQQACDTLKHVMTNKTYQQARFHQRSTVT